MNLQTRLSGYRKLPLIVLLVFSASFIAIFYGKILLSPGDYVFSDSGDGIKNYYTYAYHITHDTSRFIFEGMNYPYGEHFLYTDCHPVLANTLQFAGNTFSALQQHSIGILNFLMIISIFLTFIVCYYLLREMQNGKWISVFFAVSATLLAPQIFRLGGHYALSYSLAIPLSWLLLIRLYSGKDTRKYFVLLMINNLFWLFIHAYLGVIVLFFLISIAIIKLIYGWYEKVRPGISVAAICTVVVPLGFYYLFATFTDPYDGRTDNPSGFFLYNAEPDDVFIPHHPPIRPLLDMLTGNAINLKWEAWSYVGFAATILAFALIISLVLQLFRKRFDRFSAFWFSNKMTNISLLAAFVVLLFAMGFPFRQFPVLLDWFPFIKQFRATGRFAWPFYFAMMVFAASVYQSLMNNSKRPAMAASLIFAVLIMNVVEAIPYHRKVSGNITRSANLFHGDQLSAGFQKAIRSVNPEDYQAIITLPFYYYGSESFARPRNDDAVKTSLVFSYHTGIPNVCASLTRTTVQASKKIIQLISPAFYPKVIRDDFPNKKPFLIVKTKDPLTRYEHDLLDRAELMEDYGEFSLFVAGYDDLFANTALSHFNEYDARQPLLFAHDGFQISDSTSFFFYEDFEHSESNIAFRGSGAFEGMKKGKNMYAEFGPGTFEPGQSYHFSIWMYNGLKDALNLWFRFIVEEWNPKTDQWNTTTFFPEHSEVIFGNWSLVEGEFSVQSHASHVYFVTKGKADSKARLIADDLLIKSAGTDVYRLQNNNLFFNNHKIILPDTTLR
jgi:hypothetical protein